MLFYYKAKKLSGEEIEGEKEADNEFELAKIVKKEGYTLIYFKEKKGGTKKSWTSFLSFLGGIPLSEKMIFSRNLAVMIGAGIPLSRGIETLERQTEHKKFQKVLKSIAEELKKGKPLNESMKEYPKVFPPIFSAMVKTGEKTGKLDESLKLLSNQLQKDYDLRRKIRGALVYPAIVVTAMIVIGILMMIYVVPTLVATFEDLGADLPPTTKFIIGLSNFLVNNGLLTLMLAATILGVGVYAYSKPKIKNTFDFIILRFPLIGPVAKKVNIARTSRALSSLISAGIDILEALEIGEEVLQNHYYKNVLKEAKEKVQKGEPISKIFSAHPTLYSAIFSEMLSVGEETGKLSEMLVRVATFYEDEVAAVTKNLSTVIEPILMLLIGAAVGFFAISMLQPMYSMLEGI